MRELELDRVLQEAIANTAVGKKVTLDFKGNPIIIDIKMKFLGGWEVTQTVIPGRLFEFTKGEEGYLLGIDITFNPYEGIKPA